jgi:F0F1-type ATP synthase assembly protein I
MRGLQTNLGLLFHLSALTLGATLGPLLLGVFLDRTLGSAPFITLGLTILGILAGTVAIYRIVNQEYKRIGGSKG